jgi:hypothetical protein
MRKNSPDLRWNVAFPRIGPPFSRCFRQFFPPGRAVAAKPCGGQALAMRPAALKSGYR